jgi:hypothetical protein
LVRRLSEGLGIATRRPEPAHYDWCKPENANRSGKAGHKRQYGFGCRCTSAGSSGSLQLILACKRKDGVGGESAHEATNDGWPKEALLLVDCEFRDAHLHIGSVRPWTSPAVAGHLGDAPVRSRLRSIDTLGTFQFLRRHCSWLSAKRLRRLVAFELTPTGADSAGPPKNWPCDA